MLELVTSYSLSQVPYITYDALEEYAESLIRDFCPQNLCTPGVVDVERMLEYYLGLDVDFQRIVYEQRILGLTAFSDGVLDVLSADTNQPETIFVKRGTVIIDTSLTTKSNLQRRRFTMTHEGSHWLLHRKALAPDNPYGNISAFENQYIAAKTGRIDYSRSMKERTDIDIMERQADFLAASILMPRPALRKSFRTFFEENGEKPRRIVRNKTPMDDCFAKQLTEYIADVYAVSKRAALIRLEKLGAIADR